MLMALAGWWSDQRQEAVAYLIEENRLLRAQLRGRRLRLTDEDRRRVARGGPRLGRRLLGGLGRRAGGWRGAGFVWPVVCWGSSPRSSRPTGFCGGIAS